MKEVENEANDPPNCDNEPIVWFALSNWVLFMGRLDILSAIVLTLRSIGTATSFRNLLIACIFKLGSWTGPLVVAVAGVAFLSCLSISAFILFIKELRLERSSIAELVLKSIPIPCIPATDFNILTKSGAAILDNSFKYNFK